MKLYWLSEGEWPRIEPLFAAPPPWGASGRRSSGDQRHHAHAAFGVAVAGLPCGLWPVYDDLQPLQPVEPARKWLCRVSPAICLRANPDQGRREDEPDRLLVLGWRVRRISYGLIGAAAGEIAKVRNVFQPCGVFFAPNSP